MREKESRIRNVMWLSEQSLHYSEQCLELVSVSKKQAETLYLVFSLTRAG